MEDFRDYSLFLDSKGLKGARIGIFNLDFYDSDEYDEELFMNTILALKEEGAIVIEEIEIPSFHREWSWGVPIYELKHSLDNYLSKLPPYLPVHSISELIQFNRNNPEKTLKYGQDKLEYRESLPNTLRNPEYL